MLPVFFRSLFYCQKNLFCNPGSLTKKHVICFINQRCFAMSDPFKNKMIRTSGILLHALVSFLLINWMFKYDIAGSWLGFTLFIIICLLLLMLFTRHLVSFIRYLQSN